MFTYLISIILICSLMQLSAWIYSLYSKEADIVDFTWAVSIGVTGVFTAFYSSQGNTNIRLLFLIINLFWSIRLSHFLLYTRVLKAGEDGRYLALRNYWGAKAQINFLFFFLAQAVLVAIMSTGFFAVTENLQFSLFRAIFAILVFLVSLVGTSISDMQLESFRQNPVNKGQVCEVGLWYYSRHPNYFFETLHWFVYPILAWGGDYFWISCLLPLLMIYLITKVSGIPYTEMQALRSRGEAYKKYQESTSVFIPWFKRN